MKVSYKVSVILNGVVKPIEIDKVFEIDLKRDTYEAQVEAAVNDLSNTIRKSFTDSVGALAFILNPFDED